MEVISMANLEFKCPCCGGTLNFDNKSQNIVCPYCDTQFTASDLKDYNEDIAQNGEEDTSWDESLVESYTNEDTNGMKIYSCNSCGGEIICEETTSSTTCPYCGNNLVVSKELHGDLKPNCIIPFKKDKVFATDALKKFIKRRPLLPGSFSSTNTIQEVKGLYVPFWIFDADVTGRVRYEGIKKRTYTQGDYEVKEEKHYSVVRDGGIGFAHVPVDGSKKMQDELMESIEPFDFNQSEDFNAAYLAGYAADRYDVSKEETFGRATTRFKQGTEAAFRRDIHGYDSVEVKESILQFSNTEARYALYPVWLLHTKWNEKHFYFAVNGESGKIAGNLPISPARFSIFLFVFWLIFGAIGFGIGFLVAGDDGIVIPLVIGLIFGLLCAIGAMFTWRRKMKNVRFQYGAANYEKPNSLNITGRKDIYLYTKTTRTKKASSSTKR